LIRNTAKLNLNNCYELIGPIICCVILVHRSDHCREQINDDTCKKYIFYNSTHGTMQLLFGMKMDSFSIKNYKEIFKATGAHPPQNNSNAITLSS
jgi:hypothetical protein